jgi:dTDP-4-amino-4,6-dideoxygalactose transaminase
MTDITHRPVALRTAEQAAAVRVLESGNFILGSEVAAFEEHWAAACGVRWAVGVGNGMDAIEIALRALGVGPGDEVITSAMTAFATVLAIARAGAAPVLADIDSHNGLLDIESVRRCVTEKTKAIVLVHLYGQVDHMRSWQTLAQELAIPLVEDCAQAHLARDAGQPAGSFGSAGAYSFYPTKNLGAAGDAGALVTSLETVAKEARALRDYGQDSKYHHVRVGLNSRLDEIQAAVLLARLTWLEEFTQRRQAIGAAYHELLANPEVKTLAPPARSENHVYHLFVVLCERREALSRFLTARGIQSAVHYPQPVHRQQAALKFRCDPWGLANAESHATSCLSIPCHPGLADSEIEAVAAAINAFR